MNITRMAVLQQSTMLGFTTTNFDLNYINRKKGVANFRITAVVSFNTRKMDNEGKPNRHHHTEMT
jgi:hypothetical protein